MNVFQKQSHLKWLESQEKARKTRYDELINNENTRIELSNYLTQYFFERKGIQAKFNVISDGHSSVKVNCLYAEWMSVVLEASNLHHLSLFVNLSYCLDDEIARSMMEEFEMDEDD